MSYLIRIILLTVCLQLRITGQVVEEPNSEKESIFLAKSCKKIPFLLGFKRPWKKSDDNGAVNQIKTLPRFLPM